MKVFVVNCGSSSIKYQLFDMADQTSLASGIVERVGSDDARMRQSVPGREAYETPVKAPDHHDGMQHVLAKLVDPDVGVLKDISEITGVGHRVVHAGERYSDSVLIDDAVIEVIEDHSPLSPLHNPPNLAGIKASIDAMGQTPQVAVFDTAFFAQMPERAWRYAVPDEWYQRHRVRKYGFHGTSHRYVTERAAERLGKPVDQVDLITCHLGNGCSMTAIHNGKAVDHSMGMTPLAGLVMGTRSGDIDPAVIFYMLNNAAMSAEQIDKALNKESGLLGISGVSNDMRDCLEAAQAGNERARLAVDMFSYAIQKRVGSYLAALPRLDALVFTGGIGENSRKVRAAVAAGLSGLGVELDVQLNETTRKGAEGPITTARSKIPIWVVPTQEELMIARDTARLIG